MNFHYDSYVVSALIPLDIPASGPAGDLLIIPNVRRVRGTYLLNVFDKIILDNKCSQRIIKWLVRTNRIGHVRLRLVPGDLYIFWGYKSIHTNEACSGSALRSTLIYHYANPHTDSVFNRVLKSAIHIGRRQALRKWLGRKPKLSA